MQLCSTYLGPLGPKYIPGTYMGPGSLRAATLAKTSPHPQPRGKLRFRIPGAFSLRNLEFWVTRMLNRM